MTLSMVVGFAWCLAVIPFTADEAELAFSGAVVESTCRDIATDATTPRPASRAAPPTCVSPGAIAAAATGYSSSTVKLTGAENDRLLRYFVYYVKANPAAATAPVLLTRAYP